MISGWYNHKGWQVAERRRQLLPVLFLLLVGSLAGCAQADSGVLAADVLFHDEFVAGQMAPWQLEGDALGRSSVVNEQLILELNAPHIMQFVTLPQQTFHDFVLDVQARPLKGDLANSYGVLFRLQDANQFYRFELTGSGTYMLERRNGDGSWTRFIEDWTAHPAIQQGHHVTNRIRVQAIGSAISVYVNDNLVQQVDDSAYAAGQIALDAGTFGDGLMQVAFDNVVVRRP